MGHRSLIAIFLAAIAAAYVASGFAAYCGSRVGMLVLPLPWLAIACMAMHEGCKRADAIDASMRRAALQRRRERRAR